AAVLSPHYVKTEAAVRALTAFAALAGVVVTTAVFLLYGGYFLRPIIDKISAGEFGLGTAADFTFLLLVPVVYGAVFLLIAGLARAGGGWLYAQVLSSAIHGGVLGAAFGDDGRFKLTGIRRLPPYLSEAKEQRIDALSFGGVDDAAVFVAAQKLYDSIVAAEGPEGGITDADTMWKRLSDALYHNAYMRDDGVIAVVAEHLGEARDEGTGRVAGRPLEYGTEDGTVVGGLVRADAVPADEQLRGRREELFRLLGAGHARRRDEGQGERG
ncbi:hypothetical protein J0H58_07515, partial [bacterium]|nr:hypothetical protein [bacterium]